MRASLGEDVVFSKVHKESGHLMWLGWALLLMGLACLVLPLITGLAAARYAGWALVLSGAVMLGRAFWIRRDGQFFAALLFGVLSLASGVFIVTRPTGGEFAVALCLGVVFLLQGGLETALAFQTRPLPGWGWMLVSALASVALSVVILAGGRSLSVAALGAVVGVNFLSSGLAFLMIGAAAKSEIKVRPARYRGWAP